MTLGCEEQRDPCWRGSGGPEALGAGGVTVDIRRGEAGDAAWPLILSPPSPPPLWLSWTPSKPGNSGEAGWGNRPGSFADFPRTSLGTLPVGTGARVLGHWHLGEGSLLGLANSPQSLWGF